MAIATAERRWEEVGIGNEAGSVGSVAAVVEFEGTLNVSELDEVKKDVGRAMRTTPRREIREAYCAERGNGSRRNR